MSQFSESLEFISTNHFQNRGIYMLCRSSSLRIAATATLALFLGATVATEALAQTPDQLVAMIPPGTPLAKARTDAHAPPPGVPDDYEITPNGYFDSSCIQRIEGSDTVLDDNSVKHADGSITPAPVCTKPHYLRDGTRVEADQPPFLRKSTTAAPPLSSGHGWVETEFTAPTPVSVLYTTWQVPNAPYYQAGQTIHLFPGLEPNSESFILQTVLSFNGFFGETSSGVNLANKWTIASWDCCLNGVQWYSTPLIVSPGQTIYGEMYTTVDGSHYSTGYCTKAGVCPNWNVVTYTDSAATELPVRGNTQPMDYVFGGALEEYYVDNCAEYPDQYWIAFNEPLVYSTKGSDNIGTVITDGWPYTEFWQPTGNPNCSFNALEGGFPNDGHEPTVYLYWTP
jgi:hypothetical protein